MRLLRRLWASLGFRLAFYYGLLVTVTLLAALGIVHLQTVGVIHQSVLRQVQAAEQQLMARFADGGTEALAAEIATLLRDEVQTDVEIYLLVDPQGQPLAGNIAHPPGTWTPETGTGRHAVIREGRAVNAHLVTRSLEDGALLVVGQDLRELDKLEALVGRASAAAAIVSLLLLVGGTFVFRVELERSIAALRRTADRIAAGELQERVELTGDEDEFTLLKHDINSMLDRIQSLMEGVRNVSDSVAHNLRTPLTRVLLRLRAAQDGAMGAQERQEVIAAAMRDLQDLTATFEKLLQISEAESGARRRRFEHVALHAVADDVVELYDALAESRGVRLAREPREPADLEGDRDLLADALANLVDNALKYGGDGATVRVGTSTSAGWVRLTVQDDGPGVPAGEHARIGTRFHRLDRSRPGHGLGLASVRAIVALHGGKLRFADAAPGLRVEVELPSAHGSAPA